MMGMSPGLVMMMVMAAVTLMGQSVRRARRALDQRSPSDVSADPDPGG